MASKPGAKPLSANKTTSTAVKTTTPTKPVVAKPAAQKTAVAKPAATKPSAAKIVPKPPVVAKKVPTAPAIKVVNKTATETEKDKAKTSKVKMERDSFTMPKEEYAQIATLKKRLEGLGKPVKKSELLRAGLKLLSAMDDASLKTTMATVPTIKTGRPKK
ncbi:MAG: hypothetical protein CTY26_03625 [Methylophilus sp.]|nr:hypothetical protein [Methylophilus sp.]PPD12831.1 MAG: hypothetical protein CTY26_03625 [Methylophilus sp.]